MKYAVAGMTGFGILLLAGVTVQTVQTKAVRQNELDTALSNAMRRSMETVSVNPIYPIQSEEELKADVMEYLSESLNGNGTYRISFGAADPEHGILNVRAEQTYAQAIGTGKVVAEKTVILEEYQKKAGEYFTVSFRDPKQQIIKQLRIHGGDFLTADILPAGYMESEGEEFLGWKKKGEGDSWLYTKELLEKMPVLKDMEFISVVREEQA